MLDSSASAAYAALHDSLRALRHDGLPAAEAELISAAADARLFEEPDVDARTAEAYAALRRLEAAPWLDVRAVRRLRNELMHVRCARRAASLGEGTQLRVAALMGG